MQCSIQSTFSMKIINIFDIIILNMYIFNPADIRLLIGHVLCLQYVLKRTVCRKCNGLCYFVSAPINIYRQSQYKKIQEKLVRTFAMTLKEFNSDLHGGTSRARVQRTNKCTKTISLLKLRKKNSLFRVEIKRKLI